MRKRALLIFSYLGFECVYKRVVFNDIKLEMKFIYIYIYIYMCKSIESISNLNTCNFINWSAIAAEI